MSCISKKENAVVIHNFILSQLKKKWASSFKICYFF